MCVRQTDGFDRIAEGQWRAELNQCDVVQVSEIADVTSIEAGVARVNEPALRRVMVHVIVVTVLASRRHVDTATR